jgi:hypothetical protein
MNSCDGLLLRLGISALINIVCTILVSVGIVLYCIWEENKKK